MIFYHTHLTDLKLIKIPYDNIHIVFLSSNCINTYKLNDKIYSNSAPTRTHSLMNFYFTWGDFSSEISAVTTEIQWILQMFALN